MTATNMKLPAPMHVGRGRITFVGEKTATVQLYQEPPIGRDAGGKPFTFPMVFHWPTTSDQLYWHVPAVEVGVEGIVMWQPAHGVQQGAQFGFFPVPAIHPLEGAWLAAGTHGTGPYHGTVNVHYADGEHKRLFITKLLESEDEALAQARLRLALLLDPLAYALDALGQEEF